MIISSYLWVYISYQILVSVVSCCAKKKSAVGFSTVDLY